MSSRTSIKQEKLILVLFLWKKFTGMTQECSSKLWRHEGNRALTRKEKLLSPVPWFWVLCASWRAQYWLRCFWLLMMGQARDVGQCFTENFQSYGSSAFESCRAVGWLNITLTNACREEPIKGHTFYLHCRDNQGCEPLLMGHSEEICSL